MAKHKATLVTDGSYDPQSKRIGAGIVLRVKNAVLDGIKLPGIAVDVSIESNLNEIRCCRNARQDSFDPVEKQRIIDTMAKHGPLFSEIAAARRGLWLAVAFGARSIDFGFDCNGIPYFSQLANLKKQHDKIPYVRDFAQFFSELSKHVYIKYTKIKAHSGDPMNTLADRLAKGREYAGGAYKESD